MLWANINKRKPLLVAIMIWPFEKHVERHSPEQEYLMESLKRIDTLTKAFPIGSAFNYLGVMCRVTNTVKHTESLHGTHAYASLSADYVDSNGAVRHLTLSYAAAMRLLDENAEGGEHW